MIRALIILLKIKLIFLITILISGSWYIYNSLKTLPNTNQLKEYYPPSVSRIYSKDGILLKEIYKEKRLYVPMKNIPKSLIEAFISAEDKNFYSHPGIDLQSIIRAIISNFHNIIHTRRLEGGSTITQQVVKNILLTSERSIKRKIKEAALSYIISKSLSKDEILELYLNQIYLGEGSYGVAAAAIKYFGKSLEELNITESALLAGLPKAPSRYNPYKNFDQAKKRADYVINRMNQDGLLSDEVTKKALSQEIKLKDNSKRNIFNAPHYSQIVITLTKEMLGNDIFDKGGLTIITSMNSIHQKSANLSLVNGIKMFDHKIGYRGKITSLNDISNWNEDLNNYISTIKDSIFNLAVILESQDEYIKIGFKNGNTQILPKNEILWTLNNSQINDIFKIGDVITVSLKEDNNKKNHAYINNNGLNNNKNNDKYELVQIPEIDGGIISMNPITGQVYSLAGGYNYEKSNFDRATQAYRQPGSIVKPFVYLAALEKNISPNEIFVDEEYQVYLGKNQELWTPKNWYKDHKGEITLRHAFEQSVNIVTVKISELLGIESVCSIFERLNIYKNPPKMFSLALGAMETTLEKITLGYSSIANGGNEVKTNYIEMIKDHKGKVIYKRDKRTCDRCKIDNIMYQETPIIGNNSLKRIVDQESNYQVISLLEGSVQRGTSRGVKSLNIPQGGKTGTTNNTKDTWYMGITPNLVVGTYIGFDTPKSLGKNVYASHVALPIYKNYIKKIKKIHNFYEFKVPEGLTETYLDPITGEHSDSKDAIKEYLKDKQVPKHPATNIPAEHYPDHQNESFNQELENLDSLY